MRILYQKWHCPTGDVSLQHTHTYAHSCWQCWAGVERWCGVMCSAKWNNMKWRLEVNRRIFFFVFLFCASIHKNTYPFRNVLHSIDKSWVLRFTFWISLAKSMELVAQPSLPALPPICLFSFSPFHAFYAKLYSV